MNPAALAWLRALAARARLPEPAGNTAELATDRVELCQAYLEMVRAGAAAPELDGLGPTELVDQFRRLVGHKRP